MKVAIISEYFPPFNKGGAEISTALLVEELSKNNKLYVLTQKHQNNSWSYHGVSIIPCLFTTSSKLNNVKEIINFLFLNPLFYPWLNLIRIIMFVIINKIDLINIVATSSNLIPLIFSAVLTNRPIVVDVRGGSLICPTDFSRKYCIDKNVHKHHCFKSLCSTTGVWSSSLEFFRIFFALYKITIFTFYKYLLKLLNRYKKLKFVTLSNFVKEQLILDGYSSNKIEVIYNMLDKKNIIRTKVVKKKQILYIGRLEIEKGIHDVFSAFETLRDNSIELIIVGEGSQSANIKNHINERSLNNIKLQGYLSSKKLLALFKSAKVIIAPSIWPEPFGRFIQDSYATGIPLITTKVGGIPEGIKNGQTGLLIEPNNPQQLVNAIKELLSNKKLYNHIVKNLKKETYRFSPEKIGRERIALYEELLKRK